MAELADMDVSSEQFDFCDLHRNVLAMRNKSYALAGINKAPNSGGYPSVESVKKAAGYLIRFAEGFLRIPVSRMAPLSKADSWFVYSTVRAFSVFMLSFCTFNFVRKTLHFFR